MNPRLSFSFSSSSFSLFSFFFFADLQHSIDQDDITWGVAYKIPESKVAETKAYLDHREKNGYETHFLDIYQPGSDIPLVEKVCGCLF